MQVKLTPKERRFFRLYAKHVNLSPKELLYDFITDLCEINGNGGSDERDYALAWFERRYGCEIYENHGGEARPEIPYKLWDMEKQEVADMRQHFVGTQNSDEYH